MMSVVNCMYVNSLASVRVKGGENETFRTDSGVRQGCIMSPWLLNVYMDSMMKEVKMEMGGGSEILGGGERVKLTGLLYSGGLVFCGVSGEDLRVMAGRFVEVRMRRINAGKNKVMELGGEEGLKCEVCLDTTGLKHVSEFKYLGCRRKMANGKRVSCVVRSLVNARGMQLD